MFIDFNQESKGKRENERERGKHSLDASHVHPDRELNLKPFGLHKMFQST